MSSAYSKKTYVIDLEERVGRRAPRPEAPALRKLSTEERMSQKRCEKHPGVAVFWSSLIWGIGQAYAGSLVWAMIFFLAQIGALFGYLLVSEQRDFIVSFMKARDLSESYLLLGGLLGSSILALIYLANIYQAYHLANAERRKPFQGVDYLMGILCYGSFFPGMGQLLNAQPRKALFYLTFPCLVLATGSASLLAWSLRPALTQPEALFWVEMMFVLLSFALLGYFIVALVSFQDAIQVAQYPEKRQPVLQRWRWTWNRIRHGRYDWGYYFSLNLRQLIAVGLLAMTVYMGMQFMPVSFYDLQCKRFSQELDQRGFSYLAQLSAELTH